LGIGKPASCAAIRAALHHPLQLTRHRDAMTPQSSLVINAPIREEARGALETLLGSMNLPGYPGMADPQNKLLPFGKFGALHFARFFIAADETLKDFACAALEVPIHPITLVFMCDCDGSSDDLLADLVENAQATAGLRRIFAYCAGFAESTDLLVWMKEHRIRPAASYVNWIGRSVLQVHKEAELRTALQQELAEYVRGHPNVGDDVRKIREHLVRFAHANPDLLPCKTPTPIGWWLANWLHFFIIPVLVVLPWVFAVETLIVRPWLLTFVVAPFGLLAVLVFFCLGIVATWTFALLVALGLMLVPYFLFIYPLLLIPLVIVIAGFAIVLRYYEKTEPEVIRCQTPEHDDALAVQEEHDVSNQFTVIGSVKPSTFRRVLLIVILWFTQYGTRHIYNRGFLARIQTIHFAHWIFVNNKRRVLFLSNYDGNRHAYMDDFINKVGWGLNIIFGNGFGYPRTRWMIWDGAKNELRFKDTNRNHQIATQVWFKAYPGLTAFDLARNTRIRIGLQKRFMREAKIRAWLRDL
jgi:hypothetical protein